MDRSLVRERSGHGVDIAQKGYGPFEPQDLALGPGIGYPPEAFGLYDPIAIQEFTPQAPWGGSFFLGTSVPAASSIIAIPSTWAVGSVVSGAPSSSFRL